jgi:Fe-S cluster biogenesis protein NfuA/nitrite reductase/ring-hydroxylating ferredoxin subunit
MQPVAERHMTEPAAEQPPDHTSDRLREAGQRIESLLNASSAGGAAARERAEELVRLVVDLYGAGLERMLDVLYDAGRLDEEALEALADDDLVASLLLVHGLHPYDITTRVERALDSVRPYLGSHGGDVELVEVTAESVVRLRLLGSCDGCPSSSVTLTLAVEGAVEAAAPEVTGIEVETPTAKASTPGLIPVDALRSRLGDVEPATAAGWEPVPDLADLAQGEVRTFEAAGVAVAACRVGSDLFAYRDQCPHCTGGLAGATLARKIGADSGAAILLCPGCRAHYDVRRAGASLDHEGEHLDPLPLLTREGVVSLAVPGSVTA